MTAIRLQTPLESRELLELRAGDRVLLSGVVYTARDAAHQRMVEALDNQQPLPFDPIGQIIYYVGPTPGREGQAIGAAGPTTAGRMDSFAPRLIEVGLAGMIGKGTRSPRVVESMVEYGAVYFLAIGGAGALLGQTVRRAEIIAYPELGPEAVRLLVVEEMPLIVGIDAQGNDLYRLGPEEYLRSRRRDKSDA
ncbi:MAG: Fe-S-containing hydro-lyase [Bacillota bacterium]